MIKAVIRRYIVSRVRNNRCFVLRSFSNEANSLDKVAVRPASRMAIRPASIREKLIIEYPFIPRKWI